MDVIAASIVAAIALLSIAGVVYRIRGRRKEQRDWKAQYPQLEQLLAVYSLIAWKSPDQGPPLITQDSEWGGKVFELDTSSVDWENYAAGNLFGCFVKPVYFECDGERFQGYQLTSNEDYWFRFRWESVFGYELDVEISPQGEKDLYKLRDDIQDEVRYARENERFDAEIAAYVVRIGGLPISGSVTLVVASGHLHWLSNGGVDVQHEWVIYTGEAKPISVGALNKLIQLLLRRLQIAERDLSSVAPQLEVKWHANDQRYIEGIFAELDKLPDARAIVSAFQSPDS